MTISPSWPSQWTNHCVGCRCFPQWQHFTTFTPPYQPRHRKPGPAQ